MRTDRRMRPRHARSSQSAHRGYDRCCMLQVWYADTGERLGTYNGHTGAVWDVDVNCTSLTLAVARSCWPYDSQLLNAAVALLQS